jgi:hypothetical protein
MPGQREHADPPGTPQYLDTETISDRGGSQMSHLRTILMDRPTYDAYKEFGTQFEPNGKPVTLLPRKPLDNLTASEREIYDNLSDPKWAAHRRFEQERVPLPTALAHVQRVMARKA